MDARSIAEQIFLAGVRSVLPGNLIREHVSLHGSDLSFAGIKLSLDEINNIFVIGAGKASAVMAKEMEEIVGHYITSGHVVVKYGHGCDTKLISIKEAGHPVPDSGGVKATEKIIQIATQAKNDDLVVCVLSGGGSALLADHPPGITLEEMILLNELLLKSGADIREINTVRKHLSLVKGGQLAKIVYPATLISLILSDVIDDPLDVIASGPTVADPTTFADALTVLDKYSLVQKTPASIISYLQVGMEGALPETPGPQEECFSKTYNIIIGSNKSALNAAQQKATDLGLNNIIVTNQLKGSVTDAADHILDFAIRVQQDDKVKKPVCLLYGGESTIKIQGIGLGGRNQHLALYAASKLKDKKGITLLTAGTDGTDGPTDAAGAVVDSTTGRTASQLNLKMEDYLQTFDSYNFFKKAGGHINTGPTMTNVMDLVVVIVE